MLTNAINRSVLPPAAIFILFLVLGLTADVASAQSLADTTAAQPTFNILPQLDLGGEEDYALPIQLLLLLTVLSLAPAIVVLMTSFTRLIVVFSILRTALGIQQSPPAQVIIGLSLFLTFFIMNPVITQIHDDALQPYVAGEIGQKDALDLAAAPMKKFMLSQTREKDLMLFMDLADIESFSTDDSVPLYVLVPGYIISELRIAFQIGFMVFLPFLIVDLVVASVLMSMGMMMLPPVMISLPVKLLLFVLTDGWYLIVESVVRAYTGT
ncbi:MAG: flagellar type III secretion system pore protein FliP [Rhodothermales bacterium]